MPSSLSIAAAAEIAEHEVLAVTLADRYRTDRIFTLDQRDYRAMQPLTHGLSAFRVLPADN